MLISFGDDFSVVAEKVQGIELTGPKVDDRTLEWLSSHRGALVSLKSLNLSGSAITDAGLQHVAAFPNLHKLDLSATAITGAGLYVLRNLGALGWLGLHNAKVGWFARTKLKWQYPKLQVAV